ncbi:uncharacterized protein LOC126748156 [Anthonomus grandis grandis]|uniref:uncharacterized protein LOC126748156 n=1 Tax=Anthonomus grandis grandis TaxID=2921223 RepID=UPI002165CB05|nr:uncharacterized protein LOC126748156 [Anthonomus grandis grandis]
MGFNKVAVGNFFNLLIETVDKYQLTADKISNVDETGVSVNPKGMSKIIATKGKRQVGALTSGERGETVTVQICFSASGAYMPPMFIFGRKKMQQAFVDEIVPGGWVELNDTLKYRPMLLLDGHSFHIKKLKVINYAREHGVILICYPPHCTHRLQALDVALIKPMIKAFAKPSKDRPILLLLDGHSSHTKKLEVINYARKHGVILICYPPHCTHRLPITLKKYANGLELILVV